MAPPMEIRAITWNLFHGRDFPPDPALHTWRSRLRRTTERNATHVQVNRELLREFAAVLGAARWDVALLQECPPRWSAALAAACRADAQRSLTSRNWLGPVRSAVARWNPDLLGSWEGGSNLTLVRGPDHGGLVDRRELVLRRRPERRTMAFARLGSGLCVANLHASTSPARAEADVRRAAEAAVAWAGDAPLILGGDFNVRPEPTRACSRSSRGASASGRRPAPIPSTTSSAEGSRSSTRLPPGRPRRGSCPARASGCASRTTPRSKPRFATRNGSTARVAAGMR